MRTVSFVGNFVPPIQISFITAEQSDDMKMTGVMSPDELTARAVSHQQVANLLRNNQMLQRILYTSMPRCHMQYDL
jgi:hypothetical protein